MEVRLITIDERSIKFIVEHNNNTSFIIHTFDIKGNFKRFTITDYLSNSGNISAIVQFKLNISYGGILSTKHITQCYKIILDSQIHQSRIYVDGILKDIHDINW